MSKLLLRHGLVYSEGKAWTGRHDQWLRSQRFEQPALQVAFDSAYETVLLTRQRRDHLDAAIEALAADSDYTPIVHRLGCLRGVSTLTGFGLAVEIGDWSRFTGASIGSFVGLVPSEHSSGHSRSQGSITKTGNGHARRLLVEASWHYRSRYQANGAVATRLQHASPGPRARGHDGNKRLHHRWTQFTAPKKRPTIANVAVAWELAGWCWSLAVLND